MADLNFERKAKVYKIVENALPTVKERVLRDFDRMTFKTDEDFTEYLAETSALVDFGEEKGSPHKNCVIDANRPVDLNKVSPGMKNFVNERNGVHDANWLGGKTGSENPYQAEQQKSGGGDLSGKEV
ncbi:MAG: hypothetical protein Q8N05_02620 [Bacteroidota bacterium]|nr:hypothetical protein [Bacteroidota bacterium]